MMCDLPPTSGSVSGSESVSKNVEKTYAWLRLRSDPGTDPDCDAKVRRAVHAEQLPIFFTFRWKDAAGNRLHV
ncbi:hypothetical protein JCM31598_13640 [Desulfonatronum parangueonense]